MVFKMIKKVKNDQNWRKKARVSIHIIKALVAEFNSLKYVHYMEMSIPTPEERPLILIEYMDIPDPHVWSTMTFETLKEAKDYLVFLISAWRADFQKHKQMYNPDYKRVMSTTE